MKNKKKWLTYVKTLTKEELNNLLYFLMLAFIVIITASVCAIIVSNENIEKIEKQEIRKVETAEAIRREEEKKPKFPVLSEDAKVRMENIYVPQGEEKIAYLTFDDGPSGNVTPQILDILRKEEIKATFFVLGSRVELYPELVKQEYEEGHYIANHGYSHVYTSVYSSPQAVLNEYNNTEARIKSILRRRIFKSFI